MGPRITRIVCTCGFIGMGALYGMNPYTLDYNAMQQRIDRSRVPQQMIFVVIELLGVARYIAERVCVCADIKQAWLSQLTSHIRHLKKVAMWPDVGQDEWRQVAWLLCSVRLLNQFASFLGKTIAVDGDSLQPLTGMKVIVKNASVLFVHVVPLVNSQGRLLDPDYYCLYKWILPAKTATEWRAKELLVSRYGIYDSVLVKTLGI